MKKIKSPKRPQELEVETENNLEFIECNRELVILYSQEKLFMSFSTKNKNCPKLSLANMIFLFVGKVSVWKTHESVLESLK